MTLKRKNEEARRENFGFKRNDQIGQNISPDDKMELVSPEIMIIFRLLAPNQPTTVGMKICNWFSYSCSDLVSITHSWWEKKHHDQSMLSSLPVHKQRWEAQFGANLRNNFASLEAGEFLTHNQCQFFLLSTHCTQAEWKHTPFD